MRTCSSCTRTFTPKRTTQRHCSTPCRDRMLGRTRRKAQPGATTARGYGSDHQKLRQQWDKVVQRGEAYCWRTDCRRWLPPGQPWHLGHLDDRSGYGGPECVACNLKHAAVKGNRERAQRGRYTSSTPRIAR